MKRLNENTIKLKQIMRRVDSLLNEDIFDYSTLMAAGNKAGSDEIELAKDLASIKSPVSTGGASTEGNTVTVNLKSMDGDVVIPEEENINDDEFTLMKDDWSGVVLAHRSVVDGRKALVIYGTEWKKLTNKNKKIAIALVNNSGGDFKQNANNDIEIAFWRINKPSEIKWVTSIGGMAYENFVIAIGTIKDSSGKPEAAPPPEENT